jgi:ATP-binding cassette subfamily A (ABC1) protein 3
MLHNWIANSVLRAKARNQTAHIAITLIPFKTSPSTVDDYMYFLETNLPFFMLLIYILPVYRLISNIVGEKESKARESMKIMGLKDFSYWLSWFAYHIFSVSVISLMCTLILSFNVIVNSNKLVLFLFFWIFGMSLFGFAVFI